MLYDYLGQPVSTADLKKDKAAPAETGPRRWNFSSVASSLTPAKLASIFKDADKGKLLPLLTLASELERRDAHARAQLQTRKLALAALEWRVEAASDADVKLAEELQKLVDGPLWRPAVIDAMDGINKPFSALEIAWRPGPKWSIAGFKWRDQRHFVLDKTDGDTLRLRTEAEPEKGEDLPPWKFVIHSPALTAGPIASRGLCRTLAVLYAIKTLGVATWLTHMELYGVPLRLGKYPPGASEDVIDALDDAIRSIGTDGAGVMPSTTDIEIKDGNSQRGGSGPHKPLVGWIDEQTSKAVLGQTMTADSGSSLAQAQVHQLVRRDILIADAGALAATFQRDVVRPWIDINYGPREEGAYPQLVCVTDEPEDLAAFTEAFLPWVKQGVTVETSVIRDRFGVPEPEEGAELVGKPAAPAAREDGPEDDEAAETGEEELAWKAWTKLCARVHSRLSERLAEEDEDFIDRDLKPEDWSETMQAARDAVADAASSATSFDDFLAKVEAASADGDALTKSLATKTLIARGVGDATDEDPEE